MTDGSSAEVKSIRKQLESRGIGVTAEDVAAWFKGHLAEQSTSIVATTYPTAGVASLSTKSASPTLGYASLSAQLAHLLTLSMFDGSKDKGGRSVAKPLGSPRHDRNV